MVSDIMIEDIGKRKDIYARKEIFKRKIRKI